MCRASQGSPPTVAAPPPPLHVLMAFSTRCSCRESPEANNASVSCQAPSPEAEQSTNTKKSAAGGKRRNTERERERESEVLSTEREGETEAGKSKEQRDNYKVPQGAVQKGDKCLRSNFEGLEQISYETV